MRSCRAVRVNTLCSAIACISHTFNSITEFTNILACRSNVVVTENRPSMVIKSLSAAPHIMVCEDHASITFASSPQDVPTIEAIKVLQFTRNCTVEPTRFGSWTHATFNAGSPVISSLCESTTTSSAQPPRAHPVAIPLRQQQMKPPDRRISANASKE